MPAPERPTVCPTCGRTLDGIKWGLFHSLDGPVDFTQCPHCQRIIHMPPREVPDAQRVES
jgi:hypothetical protein